MTLLVAALMLFSAGTAGAAFLVTGSRIKDETVTGRDIHDHSITAKDVKGVVRGPTGPSGPVGPAGAVGPAGPAGPAAISGPLLRTNTGTVDPFATADVSVDCPSGTLALGGGGFTPFQAGDIAQSAPTDSTGRGWTVTIHNTTNAPITPTAMVVCATVH